MDINDKRKGAHLYILSRSDCAIMFKAGRSTHPQIRVKELTVGQSFDLNILASYTDVGHLEICVHGKLADYRISTPSGRSTEWFRCNKDFTLETARDLVSSAEK